MEYSEDLIEACKRAWHSEDSTDESIERELDIILDSVMGYVMEGDYASAEEDWLSSTGLETDWMMTTIGGLV